MIFVKEDIAKFDSPDVTLTLEINKKLEELAPVFKQALEDASPYDPKVSVLLDKNNRDYFIELLETTTTETILTRVLWENGIEMTSCIVSPTITNLSTTIDIERLKDLLNTTTTTI